MVGCMLDNIKNELKTGIGNDLQIKMVRLYIYIYIYQIASWFLPSKILLVSRGFRWTFSTDIPEEIFCHSKYFVEDERDGNPIFFHAWL